MEAISLADSLFDLPGFAHQPGEAEEWLRLAMSKGNGVAKLDLAKRLLDRNGVENRVEGERLLREAVQEGVPVAKAELFQRLLSRNLIARDEREQERLMIELTQELSEMMGNLPPADDE